jgi:hypothetical protein
MSFQEVWAGVSGVVRSALHVNRAGEEVIRRRLEVCAGCAKVMKGPAGITMASRCLVCRCFVRAKAALVDEKCPEGKW